MDEPEETLEEATLRSTVETFYYEIGKNRHQIEELEDSELPNREPLIQGLQARNAQLEQRITEIQDNESQSGDEVDL
jgi:hypothetical protein